MTARNAAAQMSKSAFAVTFGVSESQLERLFHQGLPHEKKGRNVMIPMPAGRVFYHKYLVDKGKREAAPKTIDEARLRTETARAEMAELDLAERQRETMKVSDHEKLLADAFSRVSSKLTNFSARSAAASFGAATMEECEQRIEPIVAEVREELRKADDIALDDEDEEDSDHDDRDE